MKTYIPRLDSINRYDDGITLDYASMIRMWTAFDRSLNAFNRECGVPAAGRTSERASAEDRGKSRTK
jgi:hypothetical protein